MGLSSKWSRLGSAKRYGQRRGKKEIELPLDKKSGLLEPN